MKTEDMCAKLRRHAEVSAICMDLDEAKTFNAIASHLQAQELQIAQLKAATRWYPIAAAPADGEYLVYMPQERSPIQVARRLPAFSIIGNVFDFDLKIKPTYCMALPTIPNATNIEE